MREDDIDLGEGIIPIHILNLTCAVHLRQEHGFKRWQISRFLFVRLIKPPGVTDHLNP